MKNTLIPLFFLLSILSLKAQVINSVGIKNGITLSNQRWVYQIPPQIPEHHFLLSFCHVYSMEFLEHKHWGLNLDFGVVQHGYQEQNTWFEEPLEDKLKVRFNYLHLSTGIILKTNLRSFNYFVKVAPRLNYRFNVHSDYYYVEFYDDFEKWVPGFNYGIGVFYDHNRIRLSMEALKSSDFIPLLDTDPEYSYLGLKVTTEIYLINFGIAYILE